MRPNIHAADPAGSTYQPVLLCTGQIATNWANVTNSGDDDWWTVHVDNNLPVTLIAVYDEDVECGACWSDLVTAGRLHIDSPRDFIRTTSEVAR